MPHVYGIEHILYLAAFLAVSAAVLTLVKRRVRTERGVDLVIRIGGAILLLCIVWNRIAIAILRDGWDSLLPGSFCGASSLALALAALTVRRDHPVFHCLVYVAWLGALLTHLYPDFIGQAATIWYPMTISGLVHHSVAMLLATLMIATGFVRPALSKWRHLPLGLALYMVYGLFLVTALGYGDAMYIYEPILAGTPFTWWVLGAIFLVLQAAFLVAWDRIRTRVARS